MRHWPAFKAWLHAPAAEHVSVVQPRPSSQLAHTAPAAPQAVAVSDASAVHVPAPSSPQPAVQHAEASQRPVVPPEMQGAPFAAAMLVQLVPAAPGPGVYTVHESTVHDFPSLQFLAAELPQ
jgi:hypothetical protein